MVSELRYRIRRVLSAGRKMLSGSRGARQSPFVRPLAELYPKWTGDASIGNDVWAGSGALILSGTEIENGAVLGAGTVIRSSAPAYSIVAGNPARQIGCRFSDEVVAELQAIQWWAWPGEDIEAALPWLLDNDVGAFSPGPGQGQVSNSSIHCANHVTVSALVTTASKRSMHG